ncbi:hypothetical protein RvY_18348 [Ramazzottius varieornatus]|uniref:Uncharacterized protein n=1 Tax=Ramazzottius varieornatus TaxID=947166 RepID=A0A1D1W5H3_RAMVA|nr:hypothetical protein RvY_18348 [Ramazzottius varieornatus]
MSSHPSNISRRTRSRVSEAAGVESGSEKNKCPICFGDLTDIIAYQPCTHVLCFECAVRNRVLCDQKECPICRTQCAQVVLAGLRFNNDEQDNVHRFETLSKVAQAQGKSDPFYGFLFEDIAIERAYRKILTHACKFCDRPFNEFPELVKHVRDRHDHHYCNVCVSHLMLFTWEHKVYLYDELLRHMEEGDPTDKRIPAHPQCRLCKYRGFDQDDLYKHSKKNHQLCWICERTTNKVVFFHDFFQLYEHMADCHYVCKLCSNPAEAKVVSFLDEQDQAIHTAAEHSDGTIRPDVLFNFQQRGAERLKARQRRGGEDRVADEVENQRPRTPPPPRDFTMNRSQFPTLGMDGLPSHGQPTGGAAAHNQYSSVSNRSTETEVSGAAVKSQFVPPKMTADAFPELGGKPAAATSSKSEASASLWANKDAKVTAPNTERTSPKKMTRALPPASVADTFQSQADTFPSLSAPSATAMKKLNNDWTSVPVKAKKGEKTSKPPETSTATNRWDLLPQDTSPPSSPTQERRTDSLKDHDYTKSAQTSQVNGGTKAFVQHKPGGSGGGFPTAVSSDAFPSLAAPSKAKLPTAFRTSVPASATKKKVVPTAAKPSTPRAKSEKEVIAESLFRSPLNTRDLSDDDTGPEPTVKVVPTPKPAAAVINAAPYKMKTDDFPGLAKAPPKAPVYVPERQPDRVRQQKELKSQWGNTVVQYETVFTYVPPPNAKERIVALLSTVQPLEVKGSKLSLEHLQKELMEEKISALEFWMETQRIMGKKFAQVMPEVIALIPSLTVQQDLFEVAKTPIYGSQQVSKALLPCSTCRQVLKTGADKEAHEKVHKGGK